MDTDAQERDSWRLITYSKTNGATQMAIDEAILTARLEGIVPDTIRFYGWDPSAITIGYFQSMIKEIDVDRAKSYGIDAIRRYTGGGTVFHEHELTYSLIASEKMFASDIVESYRQICNCIISGLRLIGIDAEFKEINDITVSGKKISGNAQTRKKGILLQHGTILIDVDIKKMFSLLKVPDEKIKDKLIRSAEERVGSLKAVLGREMSPHVLQSCLITGFEMGLGIDLVEDSLTEREREIAQELYLNKYSTQRWSFMR